MSTCARPRPLTPLELRFCDIVLCSVLSFKRGHMFALVAARAHAFYRGTRSSSCRKPRLRALRTLRGLFTTLEERERCLFARTK